MITGSEVDQACNVKLICLTLLAFSLRAALLAFYEKGIVCGVYVSGMVVGWLVCDDKCMFVMGCVM